MTEIELRIEKLEAEIERAFEAEQLGYPVKRSSRDIRKELEQLYAALDESQAA